METIDQKFTATANSHRSRQAISDQHSALTFMDVESSADRLALSLSKAGIRRDEPVVIRVSNEASDIVAFLAVWRAGGVAVPVHRSTLALAADRLMMRLGNRFVLDRDLSIVSCDVPSPRPLLEGAGTIIFTSGSTGEPKGVVLSAERASAKLDMIQTMTSWENGENSLVNLQLTFSFGQWSTWLTLLNGGTVHLRNRFDPKEILSLLENENIQRVPVIPTMLRHLIDQKIASNFGGYFMAGGEPLPAAVGKRARAAFPAAHLGDIYGLTETGTSDFFVPPDEYSALAGTIGRPGDSIQWKIDNETGELQIRSPWRMLGYLDAPDLTGSVMRDGWFKTGDLARQEASGAIRLIGRATDQIIRSGNKIAPMEIEAVFLNHKEVTAALVVGIADPQRGEATHLAVVPAAGCQLSQEQLLGWSKDHLERFKLPDAIHILNELPSGGTGKADRKALRRYIEGLPNS